MTLVMVDDLVSWILGSNSWEVMGCLMNNGALEQGIRLYIYAVMAIPRNLLDYAG